MMIYTKFDWNYTADSGEEILKKKSLHFYSFAIISPCARSFPFIWRI
jgi:hypothetical protein